MLQRIISIRLFSFVMAYNNKKVNAIYGYQITFVSKTSTFDSQYSQYLEIFGFIRIDFMSFSIVVFLEIYSVFPKTRCVFNFADYSLKKLLERYNDVAVLCMLYKIRCNLVHPLNGALPGPYVAMPVTRSALVAHRYTYAPPRCRASQYSRLLLPFLCPSRTMLLTRYSMVWDWWVSRAGPMLFYWPKLHYPYYCLLLFFAFSSLLHWLVLWGWGLRTDRVYITLSHPCNDDLF